MSIILAITIKKFNWISHYFLSLLKLQIRNSNLELFMNSNEGFTQLEIDATPQLLENMTQMAHEFTHLSIAIENNYVSQG